MSQTRVSLDGIVMQARVIGAPREDFINNLHQFLPNSCLRFYDEDCFSLNNYCAFSKPVTVYFYDGNHDIVNQQKAFTCLGYVLDDVFITIVDDWNWDFVRIGTDRAFKLLGYKVLYQRALFTGSNGDMSSWWNGLYVAVVRKCS